MDGSLVVWGRGRGMVGRGERFGGAMEAVSEVRAVRRWRVLLAHDASTATCDALADTLERVLGSIELSDASSLEDARAALSGVSFHICLACLDLPPAPIAGVRIAQEAV